MKLLKSLFFQAFLFICIPAVVFAQSGRINLTFFGSSVCWGTGAVNDHGYAWQFYHNGTIDTLRYRYFNASTGGDNTLKVEKEDRLTKKLLPTHPKIVVLGLSLGNEGIGNAKDDHGREEILEQFRSRLLTLADSLKSLNMIPVIVNCYANNNFTPAQYDCTMRMNRMINTWGYPSINVLGAVDDLTGKWVKGYFNDALHPNVAGHKEMSYAIVPSLFDALLAGKKVPRYDWNRSYMTLMNTGGSARPLSLAVKAPMHSFTLSLRFKKAANGSIAGWTSGDHGQGLYVAGGQLRYQNLFVVFPSDSDEWTHVVLSHSYTNQTTRLFLNGKLAGSVKEQLSPDHIFFGGTSESVDLKDLSLYRSALNAGEALDLFNKKFIQSSLEFYNPLTKFSKGNQLGNFAQSMTLLQIDPKTVLKLQEVSF